jgi:long-chain acyl-CoA synthetase
MDFTNRDYIYPLYHTYEGETLRDLVEEGTKRGGDRIAFQEKKSDTTPYAGPTFNEAYQQIQALTTAFCNLGLDHTHRIAILSENRIYWAISYFAVTTGGAVCVPVDKESKEQEIFHVLHQSQAKVIIYSGKFEETILELNSRLPHLDFCLNMDLDQDTSEQRSLPILIQKGIQQMEQTGRKVFKEHVGKDDIASMLFTSGTSALPKIVTLTHWNLVSHSTATIAMVGIQETDHFFSVLPMHHIYEGTCGFLIPYFCGIPVSYAQNLRKVADNIAEAQCTVMLGVPALFKALFHRLQARLTEKTVGKAYYSVGKLLGTISNNKLSPKVFAPVHKKLGGKIRLFISGGAAIDPLISKGLRSLGFNIIQGYGLTECSPILAVNRPEAFKDAAVGLVMPCCEVDILDPNEERVGEIIARGTSVITHYHNNSELDRESFTKEGWFRTGDLGYFDDEGFLYVVGRCKNLIVTEGGKNVYPEELEEHLNRSPFILESIVTTKSDPKTKQERIHAIIVPDFEYFDNFCENNHEQNCDEVLHTHIKNEVKKVSDSLAAFKRIYDFTIRADEFIKTTKRTIKRYMIQ